MERGLLPVSIVHEARKEQSCSPSISKQSSHVSPIDNWRVQHNTERCVYIRIPLHEIAPNLSHHFRQVGCASPWFGGNRLGTSVQAVGALSYHDLITRVLYITGRYGVLKRVPCRERPRAVHRSITFSVDPAHMCYFL